MTINAANSNMQLLSELDPDDIVRAPTKLTYWWKARDVVGAVVELHHLATDHLRPAAYGWDYRVPGGQVWVPIPADDILEVEL